MSLSWVLGTSKRAFCGWLVPPLGVLDTHRHRSDLRECGASLESSQWGHLQAVISPRAGPGGNHVAAVRRVRGAFAKSHEMIASLVVLCAQKRAASRAR